jgi:hypothetical protein
VSDQSHDIHDEGTTVSEAARILGITEGAVRKRVERRKLAAEHTQDGRLMVYLGRDTTTTDTTRDRPRQSRDASEVDDRYIRSLEEQVQYLRSQLEQEREARTEERRRQDTVVAQLSRANEEQARTIRELEAPQEATEAAETVEEEADRAEPHSAAGEAQDELGAERARREMAESTLHEGMAAERRRREEAERERDDLRQELFGRRGRTEDHEETEKQQGRGQPRPEASGAQEAVRRPWWRRLFRE